MSDIDITTLEGRAALRELRNAGTPGTWVALGNSIGAEVDGCTCVADLEHVPHDQYCGLEGPVVLQADEDDTKLAAAAVNALPALLDALDYRERLAETSRARELNAEDRAEKAEAALDAAREELRQAVTDSDSEYDKRQAAEATLGRVRDLLDRHKSSEIYVSDVYEAIGDTP